MKYQLSDIFIGDFVLTQKFGINPQNYAQFGLKGHNGLDFGCPSNTQLVATADGWVSEVGSDPTGYGNYVKIVHDGYLTICGHLDHAVIKINDRVVKGQLIGLSDNSGNSTGPHLHFGVAPCNQEGIKTEVDNGFSGYIDPNGDRCEWHIENLQQPIIPGQSNPSDLQAELDKARLERDRNWNLYVPFKDAGFENIEAVQIKIKQLNETIDNLNSQIQKLQKDTSIKDTEISTLKNQALIQGGELESLNQQAKTWLDKQKIYEQMEKNYNADKINWTNYETTTNRQVAQLKNTSFSTAKTSILIQELVKRVLHINS